MMKKLLWSLAAVCLLMVAVAAFGPSHAAGTFTLKIATLSPDGTPLMDAFAAADKEIQAGTGGRVKLKVYPGGVMGNDATVLRKMKTGQIHGSTFTAGGMRDFSPNYQALSMPMMFRSYEEVDAVRGQFEPILVKRLEEKGFVNFGMMESGMAYLMSNHPIQTLDDLKGRKVWLPEGDDVGRRVFLKLGVPPVHLPLPDVLTGLQTGLVDTVGNSPIGTVVLQWFTKVQYFMDSALMYTYGTVAIPDRAWNRIPEQDRPVVRAAMEKITRQLDKSNRIANGQARETLRKQGLKFIKINDSELPRMESLAQQAVDELIAEGKFDAKLMADIRAAVQAARK
jgi:TRAP-type transport system periplasmic protein